MEDRSPQRPRMAERAEGGAVVGEEGIKQPLLGWHLLRSGVRSSWIIWVGSLLGDIHCQVAAFCSSILLVIATWFVMVTRERLAQVM